MFDKHTQLQDMRHLANCKKEPSYNFDTYHQVFEGNHGRIENLSILDLLFNEGPNTLNYLAKPDSGEFSLLRYAKDSRNRKMI